MKKIWLNVDDSDMSILLRALSEENFEIFRKEQSTPDPLQTLTNATGCTAVVSGAEQWDATMFSKLPELKLIVRYGSGVDNIDLEAATINGVAVSAATGMNARAVAEATLLHILNALRRFERALSDAGRPLEDRNICPGRELYGKTVGILGAGRIGGCLAEYLQPFHVRIVAYDLVRNPDIQKLGVEFLTTVEQVLTESDIVSIHLPAMAGTIGLIDRKRLNFMKPGAILVNTSRGAVIEEDALFDAVQSGKLSYASLDVVCEEPVSPNNRLRALENISITPHMAANTQEAEIRTQKRIGQIIREFFSGIPTHILNPEYIKHLR